MVALRSYVTCVAILPDFDVLLGRLMERRGLTPAALAERAETPESELRPVLAGGTPSDGLIRRLGPALNLHEADLFALAWLDVPEDLAPLDHRASWHLPHLAGWAARLPHGRVRALREQVTAIPQEKRTQPIRPPRPYEQFERSAAGMLLRLFANRNLGRRDAYTIMAVTGRGLSPSTVMMAGRGRKELSPEEWADYVTVLDISDADLSAVLGFDLPDPPPQRSPAVRETAGLLWEVRRLNTDQVRQIRETAERLHQH
jgi:hypothetical protein